MSLADDGYRLALEDIAGRGCCGTYSPGKTCYSDSEERIGDGWCAACLAAQALGYPNAERCKNAHA